MPALHLMPALQWMQALPRCSTLEEVDRLHVADVANDVDVPLGQEIIDQQNVYPDVVDAQGAALRHVLHVATGKSLQAVHIAIVRRGDHRGVCDVIDKQTAANVAAGIVDVADIGAQARSDEELPVGGEVHALMVAIGNYGGAGDRSGSQIDDTETPRGKS